MRKECEGIVNYCDISIGSETDKIKISLEPVGKRVLKCTVIIGSTLLFTNSIAQTVESSPKLAEEIKIVKKSTKWKKYVENYKKASGIALAGQTCENGLSSTIKKPQNR